MDSPKKTLKVTLVYPPGEQKISEPVPPPNMTIAVLADALIKAGHTAVQVDAEKDWFDRVQHTLNRAQTALLYDKNLVAAYTAGKTSGTLTLKYDRICGLLLKG